MDVVRKHFEIIDSTNTWAKQHATELTLDKMTLVTADLQTAGRGRFNRKWISASKQNVLATFCFAIEKHRQDIGNLPQILALSAQQVLEENHFQAQLKWPNDILIQGKKVAGILCETTPLSDKLMVILGIGLNINMPLEELNQIDRPATSLFVESGRQGSVEDYLELLKNQFIKNLTLFLDEGFIPFLNDYKRHLIHHLGTALRFHDNRSICTGTFEGITPHGTLLMRLPSDEIKEFVAGEIL